MAPSKTSASQHKKVAAKPARTWAETYLANYNAISAFFWFNIPLRLIQVYRHFGPSHIHEIANYVKIVQTAAILELVHSATGMIICTNALTIGLVRAPIMTTLTQVFSRLFLVWGIVDLFPNSAKDSHAYAIMLFAWSITEVIRYSYYAWNLADEAPYFLVWLRYSTFWVLYPLGTGAELWTMCRALKEAYAWHPAYAAFIVVVIIGYIPGFYTLFTHMMRQRRKVLGEPNSENDNGKKKK